MILHIRSLCDIIFVFKQGGFSSTDWFILGIELGVLKSRLAVIEQEFGKNIDRCLLKCLDTWINMSTHRTWIQLSDALHRINYVQLANNIIEACKTTIL